MNLPHFAGRCKPASYGFCRRPRGNTLAGDGEFYISRSIAAVVHPTTLYGFAYFRRGPTTGFPALSARIIAMRAIITGPPPSATSSSASAAACHSARRYTEGSAPRPVASPSPMGSNITGTLPIAG